MNLLNLLTIEKRVAGIEISDSVVRIAFFRPSKNKQTKKLITPKALLEETEDTVGVKGADTDSELVLIEEPIGANIIEEGVVIDVELLGKTLKNIWTKANLGTNYAIVAIPDDKIYSRIFSFPKSISDTRLSEAMRLAIGFQLPMNTSDVYLDWERVEGTPSVNEIFLSTIQKTVADGYVQALEKAGIKTLALESSLSAITRSVKMIPGETTIFSKKSPDGETIFALRDRVLRFSRTLPRKFVPEDKVPEEIEKVKISLSTETKGVVSEKELLDTEIREEYESFIELSSPKSKWLIALGAAIRGKLPEGHDNLVSLLPIGTEEAYAYQRATTFIALMRNLTIGVSLFFVVAYLATYLFMVSLSENTSEKVITLSAVAIPPELAQKQQEISNINTITGAGAIILAQTPTWSTVLSEIVARTPGSITISSFSGTSFTSNFSLTGTAASRDVLNNYEKELKGSALFSDVVIPLNNLEQKEKIPFTATFRLKDPAQLYYSNNQTH
ncbi:MAG: pilus assembly protein PilM [Candidatus Paceibacterota bacterium]|jgi:hypothetical protein